MALLARSILAVGLVLGLLAAAARAEEPSPPPVKSAAPGCDCCRMKAAGMSAAQMLACPRMQQCAKSGMPNALLSMKFKLGLSEDQVAKLEALIKKVQEEALALLTAEQKKALESMPGAAASQEAPSPTPAQTQPQAQAAPRWRGCGGMIQSGGCPMQR